MSAGDRKQLTVFRCVYIALLAALAVYLVSLSLPRETELLDFSKAWRVNGDALLDAGELNAGAFGGSMVMEKELPDTLSYNDRLCLTISNAHFTVSIGGREVYAYDCPENLTGKGYGIAYHTINLSPEQAGQTVRMEIRSVYDNQKSGRVYMPQIGSGGAFLYYLAGQHLLTILFSAGSLFLGILLFLLQPLLLKKRLMHSSLRPLSVVAIIAGLWMTNDTGILRLLTGNVLVDRVLDHALIFDVSACVCEIFGTENVYRTGGDEFVAYDAQSAVAAFTAKVDRLVALIAERGGVPPTRRHGLRKGQGRSGRDDVREQAQILRGAPGSVKRTPPVRPPALKKSGRSLHLYIEELCT